MLLSCEAAVLAARQATGAPHLMPLLNDADAPRPSPLIQHLETELAALRAELSQLYRTQAAAQNRQLTLSDALRDRDEEVRGLKEELREVRDRRDRGEQREKGWEERWRQRTKDMEVGSILGS